jgi:type IV pilus assembly protein PilA
VLKHLKDRRQSEEGFTLIELMVVVLIMGILMAIAIPTFLATQGSAHDAAAKSDATNAFTNEKAYYEDNQTFLDVSSATVGGSLDANLPWSTNPAGSATVSAAAGSVSGGSFGEVTSGTTGSVLLVEADSKSGDCFYIYDNEPTTTSAPVIAYAETSGGCNATPVVPTGSPAASAGNAGANVVASASLTANTWYTSW